MKTLKEIYSNYRETSPQQQEESKTFAELLSGDLGPIYGISHDIYSLKRVWIPDCARNSFHLLITGETGTGKELAAGCVHALTERAANSKLPFIRVNCAELTGRDAESELFGRRSGTYSNIESDYRGRFEQAEGGTILLDEVRELEPAMRLRLMEVMEQGRYRPAGTRDDQPLKARIIATTRSREELPQEFKWRFPEHISIPPLRERRLDIFFILNGLLTAADQAAGREPGGWYITPSTLINLMFLPWYGNAGELRSAVDIASARYRSAAPELPRFFTCRSRGTGCDIIALPQTRYDLWYHLCRSAGETSRGRELIPVEPPRRGEVTDYAVLRNLGREDDLPCFTCAEALEFMTIVYEQMEDDCGAYDSAEARIYTLNTARMPIPPLLRWCFDSQGRARDEDSSWGINFAGMTAAQAYTAYLEALRERCPTMNDATERSGLSDTTLRRHFKENNIRQYKGKRPK